MSVTTYLDKKKKKKYLATKHIYHSNILSKTTIAFETWNILHIVNINYIRKLWWTAFWHLVISVLYIKEKFIVFLFVWTSHRVNLQFVLLFSRISWNYSFSKTLEYGKCYFIKYGPCSWNTSRMLVDKTTVTNVVMNLFCSCYMKDYTKTKIM